MTTRPFAPSCIEKPGPLTFLYSEMSSTLSLDVAVFCLFSERAAQLANRAQAAATWREFARSVDLAFDELVDPNGAWGAEIAEAVGRLPEPGDSFRLADYWGNWHFAGVVIPPCQAAVLAVLDRPAILRLLSDVGFEFAFGAPGSDGDAIIFRELELIPRLVAEIGRRGLEREIVVREGSEHLPRIMRLG